jgi:hypothetical protein
VRWCSMLGERIDWNRGKIRDEAQPKSLPWNMRNFAF